MYIILGSERGNSSIRRLLDRLDGNMATGGQRPPIWRLSSFAALFADPFSEGTELEGASISQSLQLLSHLLARLVARGAGIAGLDGWGEDQVSALHLTTLDM